MLGGGEGGGGALSVSLETVFAAAAPARRCAWRASGSVERASLKVNTVFLKKKKPKTQIVLNEALKRGLYNGRPSQGYF